MQRPSTIKLVYLFEIIAFVLIVLGYIPRSFAIILAGVLIVYTLNASLKNAVLLFIASIPFFIALPLTETFDNFNTWRIISLIIFVRWLWEYRKSLWESFIKTIARPHAPKLFLKEHPAQATLYGLVVLALLSVFVAPGKVVALKEIILFVNLSFVGIVAYDLLRRESKLFSRMLRAIAAPTVLVTLVGFLQLIQTYFIDVYKFMRFWGEGVQCVQFGNQWCDIAVFSGNTWLAYINSVVLKLRLFSLFPDTHSFPIFLLLGLSAVVALSLHKLNFDSLKTAVKTRASMLVVSVPFIFLAIILTGTRGMWAAWIGVMLWAIILLIWMHYKKASTQSRNILKYLTISLVLFLLLFAPAWLIFGSPQFLVDADAALSDRLRSVLNFGETSNAERIKIWKASWESIKDNPLLGVGIGNYPVVLDQELRFSDAGSSAHNLYIHIAAVMGIPALLLALWFIWLIVKKLYRNITASTRVIKLYSAGAMLFVPWVLIYSLTDVALYDERAFLLFAATLAMIFGVSSHE